MDVVDALATRRSAGRLLSDNCPDDAELSSMLRLAMNAPDHGYLRPWRLVVVRGDTRHRLGAAFSTSITDRGGDADAAAKAAAKPLRAPLLVGIVFRPVDHPKVREWEQLAAAVGVVTNMSLLMHNADWSTIWRSGEFVDAAPVRQAMDVDKHEQLLGWLYVGRAVRDGQRGPRPVPHLHEHLSILDHAGESASLDHLASAASS